MMLCSSRLSTESERRRATKNPNADTRFFAALRMTPINIKPTEA
jgi:hypothetical protein